MSVRVQEPEDAVTDPRLVALAHAYKTFAF